MRFLVLGLSFCLLAMAAEFAGPQACAPCHPRHFAAQSRTPHAQALRPIRETPLLHLFAEQPLAERSGIAFAYEPAPGGILVRATQGPRKAEAVLEWAFGAGIQGYTPVGRAGDVYLEHRVSYYTAARGMRRTFGHPGAPSPDPWSALGLVQKPDVIYSCFHCHATGVKPGPDLSAMIPGVTCERCHGPAAGHAASPERQSPRGRFNREEVLALCGECHRLPTPGVSNQPEVEDPVSIRFAPVGLSVSACYQRSQSLTCLSCHSPHERLQKDPPHYNAVCSSCHPRPPSACRREQQNCIGCHMQKRAVAPYLLFTDHRIRVYPTSVSGKPTPPP
jgi:hypothetical protein